MSHKPKFVYSVASNDKQKMEAKPNKKNLDHGSKHDVKKKHDKKFAGSKGKNQKEDVQRQRNLQPNHIHRVKIPLYYNRDEEADYWSIKNLKKEINPKKSKIINKIDDSVFEKEPKTLGYAEYKTVEEIKTGIEASIIFEGKVAFRDDELYRAKIINNFFTIPVIAKEKNLNRCFNESIVYFEIISNDWQKYLKPKSNIMTQEPLLGDDVFESEDQTQTEDLDQEEKNVDNVIEEKKESRNEESKITLAARVVGIKYNSMSDREFLINLIPLGRNKVAFSETHKFVATPLLNKRLPKFKVDNPFTTAEGQSIIENLKTLNSKSIFVAMYEKWDKEHDKPIAKILRNISMQSSIEIELDAILIEKNIWRKDFTKETYEYLENFYDKETRQPKIPQEEIKKRWDLRNKIIFSVDPITACDIDDALSIEKVSENEYEVGVHIADPSYYVISGSPLEEDVLKRTTSTYCSWKFFPMLPPILTAELCSLLSGSDKLAFSLLINMNSEGEIIGEPKLGRSIIRSAGKLNYELVQNIYDGKINSLSDIPEKVPYEKGRFTFEEMKEKLITLNEIAKKLKKKRTTNGALSIQFKKKMQIIFDEQKKPIDIKIYDGIESEKMIEEFMLLANNKIGEILSIAYPKHAILRMHPKPKKEGIKYVENYLSNFGLKLDFSSGAALSKTITDIQNSEQHPKHIRQLATSRLFRLLSLAEYIVIDFHTLDQRRHFALNMNEYTHFTSPIRRYPDLLVHRFLAAFLDGKKAEIEQIDLDGLKETMELCNRKKSDSKKVSLRSQEAIYCIYLASHPVTTDAIVVDFRRDKLTLYCPEIDIEKDLYFKKMPDGYKISVLKMRADTIEIEYSSPDQEKFQIKLKQYQLISVVVTGTSEFPVDFLIKILKPTEVMNDSEESDHELYVAKKN